MSPPKFEDSPQFKAIGPFAYRPNSKKYQYAYATWKALHFPKPKEKQKSASHYTLVPTKSYESYGHKHHSFR